MTEEKRLPDEAVEKAAGGNDAEEMAILMFKWNNCDFCEKAVCPNDSSPREAFEKLGGVPTCPDYVGIMEGLKGR